MHQQAFSGFLEPVEEIRDLERAMRAYQERLELLRTRRDEMIKSMLEQGWSQVRLAKEFGISRARIYQLLNEDAARRARDAAQASMRVANG